VVDVVEMVVVLDSVVDDPVVNDPVVVVFEAVVDDPVVVVFEPVVDDPVVDDSVTVVSVVDDVAVAVLRMAQSPQVVGQSFLRRTPLISSEHNISRPNIPKNVAQILFSFACSAVHVGNVPVEDVVLLDVVVHPPHKSGHVLTNSSASSPVHELVVTPSRVHRPSCIFGLHRTSTASGGNTTQESHSTGHVPFKYVALAGLVQSAVSKMLQLDGSGSPLQSLVVVDVVVTVEDVVMLDCDVVLVEDVVVITDDCPTLIFNTWNT
jgi:hypothetical protein